MQTTFGYQLTCTVKRCYKQWRFSEDYQNGKLDIPCIWATTWEAGTSSTSFYIHTRYSITISRYLSLPVYLSNWKWQSGARSNVGCNRVTNIGLWQSPVNAPTTVSSFRNSLRAEILSLHWPSSSPQVQVSQLARIVSKICVGIHYVIYTLRSNPPTLNYYASHVTNKMDQAFPLDFSYCKW